MKTPVSEQKQNLLPGWGGVTPSLGGLICSCSDAGLLKLP